MFTTILTATDNSPHGQKAVELASDLAQKYSAKLLIIHVVKDERLSEDMLRMAEVEHLIEPAPTTGVGSAPPVANVATISNELKVNSETAQRLREVFGQRVVSSAEQDAYDKGVKEVKTFVEHGEPAHQILACAGHENVDLIVVGNRGMSDLKGLLMGSVSHKVSQLAPCTCITVRG